MDPCNEPPAVHFAAGVNHPSSGRVKGKGSGMEILIKALTGASALAFALAVGTKLSGVFVLGVPPEAYSRACTNLALVALAAHFTLGSRAAE